MPGNLHEDFFDLLEASGQDWLVRPIDTLSLNGGNGNSGNND